jgi:hypothetical protein
MDGGVGALGLMGAIAVGSTESNGNDELDVGVATRGGGALEDGWRKGWEWESRRDSAVRLDMLKVVSNV